MKLMKYALALAIVPMLLTGNAVAQDVDEAASGVVYVTVIGNTEISGVVEGLTSFKLETSFGGVDIPLAKVDGIKMNADGSDGAVVAFRNGDMVTGKLGLQKVTVKTDWGKAHINTNAIQTMTSTKSGRFYSDGNGSGGWRFNRSNTTNRNPRAPGRSPLPGQGR